MIYAAAKKHFNQIFFLQQTLFSQVPKNYAKTSEKPMT